MKDFQLRNETKLLFRNDPVEDLAGFMGGRRVLFVYGGGSAQKNGCLNDIRKAAEQSGSELFELSNASRELEHIEEGIRLVQAQKIDAVIGAGGANIMDCAKLIAFGASRENELWDYVKGRKNPYGLSKLPLLLMPTYPSSGSEYGLGAVSADRRTGDFGTAYGIAADLAVLVPKYSLSLDKEMTAYTGLVTLVQLSASTIGDTNPVSYDIGISVIRNVLKAVRTLKYHPDDLDARGVILYGAALSTSSRLGLGKTENYPYDIYELEFIPEVLYGSTYRKSLTTIFPRFLKAEAKYHEEDIRKFLADVFGLEGKIEDSVQSIIQIFEEIGIDMYFDGTVSSAQIEEIEIETTLTNDEIVKVIEESLR